MAEQSPSSIYVKASPSLALIKYWGKKQEGTNIPATSSLAVTLKELVTVTKITPTAAQDCLTIDGAVEESEKMKRYLALLKDKLGIKGTFAIESFNNFPKAAGLASSSSGYAALAKGFSALSSQQFDLRQLSALAQMGSGSAARSIFEGFTTMKAGNRFAENLYNARYWPELRIIVCLVTVDEKEMSSSAAMNAVRAQSIFYSNWLEASEKHYQSGLKALLHKDLDALGIAMQLSYQQMFATMLGTDPPIFYWYPQSVALIRLCRDFRKQGVSAWETMDAGPQVKILCLDSQISVILPRLSELINKDRLIVTTPGLGASLIDESEYQTYAGE